MLDINKTMSSREIADLTGKRHDHVLRDCDTLKENYEKLGLPKLGEGLYNHPNTGTQSHRQCFFNKNTNLHLMTG
jgi:phage regulator Rha-like protein